MAQDNNNRDRFFYDKGIEERQRIEYLFNNFNFHHDGLIKTDPAGNDRIDFVFISANTKIIFGEFKRRKILSWKYVDSFIEAIKFKELYKYFCAGASAMFIVEYDDFYFIWNLQDRFGTYSVINDSVFAVINATADMFNYEKGSKQKRVCWLQLVHADYIITKDFKRINYNDYLELIRTWQA